MKETINYDGKTYKVFTVTTEFGEYRVFFVIGKYRSNDSLAIQAWTASEKPEEIDCFCTLTVNLDNYGFGMENENEAYVDTNNNPWAMKFIRENKLGRKVGIRKSGYCKYPLVRFNIKKFYAEETKK